RGSDGAHGGRARRTSRESGVVTCYRAGRRGVDGGREGGGLAGDGSPCVRVVARGGRGGRGAEGAHGGGTGCTSRESGVVTGDRRRGGGADGGREGGGLAGHGSPCS